jgi:hypothetical protein
MLLLMAGRMTSGARSPSIEDIARLCPQARLEIIEDAGHFAPVEQPEPVARLLPTGPPQVAARMPGWTASPTRRCSTGPAPTAGYALNKMAMGLSTPEAARPFWPMRTPISPASP